MVCALAHVSLDESQHWEELRVLPSWQPFQHEQPWPPESPKDFPAAIHQSHLHHWIGYNDLGGDGLVMSCDDFWDLVRLFNHSTRILQCPNALKELCLWWVPNLVLFLVSLVFVFCFCFFVLCFVIICSAFVAFLFLYLLPCCSACLQFQLQLHEEQHQLHKQQ